MFPLWGALQLTRGLTCDICGKQTNDWNNTEDGWTHIDFGMKVIGHRDYQDLCPNCTLNLIEDLDERRRKSP